MFICDREFQIADKVRGVTRSGQNTASSRGSVHWARVASLSIGFKILNRHWEQVLETHFSVKDFRALFIKQLVFFIPFGSFNVESVEVASIVGRFGDIVFLAIFGDRLVVESQRIDRNLVFTGEILFHTSKETVCEIEPRYPKTTGSAVINPVLEHF